MVVVEVAVVVVVVVVVVPVKGVRGGSDGGAAKGARGRNGGKFGQEKGRGAGKAEKAGKGCRDSLKQVVRRTGKGEGPKRGISKGNGPLCGSKYRSSGSSSNSAIAINTKIFAIQKILARN